MISETPLPDPQTFVYSRTAPRQKDLWALEASAGTGKTWTIENFVADYLAKGQSNEHDVIADVLPDEIVIVTFTRASTAELVSRIRNNISDIVRQKDTHLAHRAYSQPERDRLQRALANFGQIRISTIHGFAQRSLQTLGEPLGAISTEVDSKAFARSVLRDVLRSYEAEQLEKLEEFPDGYFKRALDGLMAALTNPGSEIIASADIPGAAAVVELIATTRTKISQRKQFLGLSGYNDLLSKLDEKLLNDENALALAQTIKVLLIDEFQDTDSLQWKIFNRIAQCGLLKAFVVVGDPKQAIYGFRGGDVQIYREAVDADTMKKLTSNRRSSKAFVEGANTFFQGIAFGTKPEATKTKGGKERKVNECVEISETLVARYVDIEYEKVTAEGSLKDIDEVSGWHFRRIDGKLTSPKAQDAAVADLPGYIGGILATWEIPDPKTSIPRPVSFDDICVLSHNNKLIGRYARALQSANIPYTVVGGANIFSSLAAVQWRLLLEAVSQPSRMTSARLLAWTWFGGSPSQTIAKMHTSGNEQWLGDFHERLLRWHNSFNSESRFQFFERVIRESGVLVRLAGFESAERNITDLHHVAELLRPKSTHSMEQLVEFLAETSTSADDDGEDADVAGGVWSRRVDGDRKAVQLMTIHQAKGLEFPIVLLPFMNKSPYVSESVMAYRVYKGDEGHTVVDITASKKSPGSVIKSLLLKSEHLRKAYVALTRASIRNVLWTWEPALSSNEPIVRDFKSRERLVQESKYFEWDLTTPALVNEIPPLDTVMVNAEQFRTLPAPARRASYSELSKALSSISVEQTLPDNEKASSDGDSAELTDVEPSVADTLRGSTLLGKVVHRVLQTIELGDGDRRELITASVIRMAAEQGLQFDNTGENEKGTSLSKVVSLIETALSGDLGEVAPATTLADYGSDRRLAEVGFDFNVPKDVSVTAVIDILKKYLSMDPYFSDWLATVTPDSTTFHGFMTGSIDAVMARGDAMNPSFFIVDYKSNRLKEDVGEGYTLAEMQAAMSEHSYQLQAVIYLVALHRFVRSRLGIATYDYDKNIAGAAYLFLRGMRANEPGAGILHFLPPKQCIEELSDLFDGATYAK